MDIKEWHLRHKPRGFGYTNDTDKCWTVSTNVPSEGQRIEGIIILESTLFQNRGCLIGTESSNIYWYDGKTARPVKDSNQAHSDELNTANPTQRFVAIGAVRAVQVEEQQELRAVLGAAGVKVYFDGSKMFDIYVAESQVGHAVELLRTNRLVREKKISLSWVK